MTALDALRTAGSVEEGLPLGPLTTYKFGGPARYVVTADSEEDVAAALALSLEEGIPLVALGRGSNLLIADSGFDGVVLRLGGGLSGHSISPAGEVEAGAGAALPSLARDLAKAGRGGLEFFTGIPGSVGGAVRMNAGCHGADTSEWLLAARVIRGQAGPADLSPSDLEMTYRHTNLLDGDVVVSARFRTIDRSPEEGVQLIREITRWRRDHQPGGTLNAGSVFKNPPGDSAGRIIDEAGLKGFRIGGAEVSRRHANFFVADRNASASDVHRLVMEVRERVEVATGIGLEPEIRFVGDFG
jgi:UDP-N-acetylmuramate dehydrogenase